MNALGAASTASTDTNWFSGDHNPTIRVQTGRGLKYGFRAGLLIENWQSSPPPRVMAMFWTFEPFKFSMKFAPKVGLLQGVLPNYHR